MRIAPYHPIIRKCVPAAIGAFVGIFVFASLPAYASSLPDRLAGRFLIRVERYGESWWVHPKTKMRYYLGRPQDAFNLMRAQGIGISNKDIEKIPLIGSTVPIDHALVNRLKGNIVLQVESRGEAWYINPVDGMRFYLGRPADALAHMRNLGLGITDRDLEKIEEHPASKVLHGNVYVNDIVGYEVKYPPEWEVLNNDPAGNRIDVSFRSMKYNGSFEWPGLTISDRIAEMTGYHDKNTFDTKDEMDGVIQIGFKTGARQLYARCSLYLDRSVVSLCNAILPTFRFFR